MPAFLHLRSCLFIAFAFFALAVPAHAGGNDKGALLKKISVAKNEKEKNGLILKLADWYDQNGNDSCFMLAEKVLAVAQKKNDRYWIMEAKSSLGDYYFYRDQVEDCIAFYEEALKIAEALKNEEQVTVLYSNLSKVMQVAGRTKEATDYVNRSIAIDKKNKNIAGLAESVNNLAIIYSESGNNIRAIELHKEALGYAIKVKDSSSIALIYNDLGLAHRNMGRLQEGLKCYLLSQQIGEKIKKNEYTKSAFLNIGMIYDDMKLYEKAIQSYRKALNLCSSTGDELGHARSLNNIGYVYLNLENPDSALHYFSRAMEIKKKLSIPSSAAMTLHNIGHVYLKKKKYSTALSYYAKADSIYRQIGDSMGIMAVTNYKGLVCLEKKDYQGAIGYLNDALKQAQHLNTLEGIMENYKSLSDAYVGVKDYKNAYLMHMRFFTYQDSMLNEKISEQVNEMDAIYQASKKEKQINELNTKAKIQSEVMARQEAETKRKNAWMIAIGSGLVFMTLLLLLLIRNNRQKKAANVLLTGQKKEIEEKNTFLQSANQEITEQKMVIEEKNREILDSISYAKRLQEAILPPRKLVTSYLKESFILYLPKDIVAGDFYFMETVHAGTPDELVLFAAADCTGHGVPGAMVSVVCANSLTRTVKEFKLTQPAAILNKVRDLVIETFQRSEDEVKDGMDISFCALSLKTGKLQWAGANNPLWVLRQATGQIEETVPDKQPVGKYALQSPFTPHNIQLQQGDRIYLFTDGFADQFGGDKGKKLKASNLKKIITETHSQEMEQQRQTLLNAFESWKGDLEQVDDVCVIGVKY